MESTFFCVLDSLFLIKKKKKKNKKETKKKHLAHIGWKRTVAVSL